MSGRSALEKSRLLKEVVDRAPVLGHLRLVELRDKHARDPTTPFSRSIGRVPPRRSRANSFSGCRRPRAVAPEVPHGRQPTRKQEQPISPARVRKVHAVLSSALNSAVKSERLAHNPIEHVELPRIKGRRVRPYVWTAERVQRWQETGKAPGSVMVWTPEQTGAFLGFAVDEHLYALLYLVAFRGLGRVEVAGQSRQDTDLTEAGTITIRETLTDEDDEYDDTKSEAGERTVALDEATISALLDWRAAQERERPAAGPEGWVDSGPAFTREDRARLRPQWISTRFEELIKKYGLVRDEHSVDAWPIDRITRHRRISVRSVEMATGGEPLPLIRFHDLRHGAATLALLSNVNIFSEALGHARHSFTADTYTSVLPEVSRAAAEAVAAAVPRRSQPRPSDATNVISFADHRNRRGQHAG